MHGFNGGGDTIIETNKTTTSSATNVLSSPIHDALALFSQPRNHGHDKNSIDDDNNENDINNDDGIISACLLIMDDNHYLIEWIAYHYHVMNLRRLIIAIDPKSLTSPISIIQKWKNKNKGIDITIWTSDYDYTSKEEFDVAKQKIANEFTETTSELIEHRARQRLFYTHCLRQLKQQQPQNQKQKSSSSSSVSSSVSSSIPSSWTMLVDVDEFIRVNYKLVEQELKNATTEDTDDIYSNIPSMNKSGSVSAVLRAATTTTKTKTTITQKEDNTNKSPLFYLQSSPCVQIPRYRFVSSLSSSSIEIRNSASNSNSTIDPNNFLTQNYRNHAKSTDYKKNKISKTIIDLRRIPLQDIIEVNSIHMPIRKYCSQRNLHIQPKDSLLVINHYLGSYEQFTYRDNDARNIPKTNNNKIKTKVNVRDATKFKEHQKLSYPSETDDEIRPWLEGFLGQEEEEEEDSTKTKTEIVTNTKKDKNNNNNNNRHAALKLLEGVGQLEPKSWQPVFQNKKNNDNDDDDDDDDDRNRDRCALLFFGLTRSYKSMVLPSIIKNILRPNARHNCDVYVHYYKQDMEQPGRRNRGGILHADDIFLLENAANDVAREYYSENENNAKAIISPVFTPPIVAFTHDTPEQFNDRRSEQIRRYRDETMTMMTEDGKNATVRRYFPWKAKSYTNSSLDNIVKQWHSISTVFKLMDYTAMTQKLSYSRVGMFRSDALYVTPIDIASLGKIYNNNNNNNINGNKRYDVNNHYFVTPSFAMNPVNDRIIYGPYAAIKVWATKRFDLLEESANAKFAEQQTKTNNNIGYTMHSERFLNSTVFPAIQKLGYEHMLNGDVCFLRTRADETALLNDCSMESLIATPHNSYWNDPSSKSKSEGDVGIQKLRLTSVESIVEKKCVVYQMSPKWKFVGCGNESEYKNWGDSGWK
jgi:hypothetical protein